MIVYNINNQIKNTNIKQKQAEVITTSSHPKPLTEENILFLNKILGLKVTKNGRNRVRK